MTKTWKSKKDKCIDLHNLLLGKAFELLVRTPRGLASGNIQGFDYSSKTCDNTPTVVRDCLAYL